MISYLSKILILLSFSLIIIYNYYFLNNFHLENFDGYLGYIIILTIIYSIYKVIQVEFLENDIKFTPFSIFGLFSLHLLILSILYFSFNNLAIINGFLLFFKILFFSLLPILIILISLSFGKKIVSKIIKSENKIYIFLSSLGIGFFSFIFLLDIFGILGFYDLSIVFGILSLFVLYSYKEFFVLIKSIFTYKIKVDISEGGYLKFLTTEIFFIISTLVLSINLIGIFRPFPVGWDDLGVYMNFPHLMAESGRILSLGGMNAWQSFTGIGYLFNSPTQAFYLNNVGGFLSFITIFLIGLDLFKKGKNTFINISFFIATIFITMPMVVFQQAKDMKLDEGLFFISIISVYLLFKNYIEEKKGKKLYLFIFIGLLAGFAFTIKFTSLLLISAIIGVIFYKRLGLLGFVGYISLFLGIFTKANLWDLMNVIINPKNIIGFENIFFLISSVLGLFLIGLSFVKNKSNIYNFFKEFLIFCLGLFIAMSPWLLKNIYDSKEFSIKSIIIGTSEKYNFDKGLIHNKDELKIIEEKKLKDKKENLLNAKCPSTNEDLCRYLGYEKGINNFIKLPYNLTMQKNQKREYTDIGFLFLALLPVLFLFLPFRKKYYPFLITLFLALELFIFKDYFNSFFSNLNLPFGYLILLLFFIFPILFLLFLLKNDKENKLIEFFKLNLIFSSFYVFLWSISSFGIVWYGIVMYFSFLIMIAIPVYYLSNYEEKNEKEYFIKYFGTLIILFIFLIYAFNSIFPHSFKNLKGFAYEEYKTGLLSSDSAIFSYHNDYLKILFELNIKKEKRKNFLEKYINNEIKASVKNITDLDINEIEFILKEIISKYSKNNIGKIAKDSLENIYKNVFNPNNDFKNKDFIYRAGTFLSYNIVENNKRLLNDNLLYNFDYYIYNFDKNKTIENFKKLKLKYLILDLNAATIDKDERHNLTDRYEKLLGLFTHKDLELIETDSICLRLALDNYKNNLDSKEFLQIAGVNYDSFSDKKIITKSTKAEICYNKILELSKNNKINKINFNYLLNIVEQYKILIKFKNLLSKNNYDYSVLKKDNNLNKVKNFFNTYRIFLYKNKLKDNLQSFKYYYFASTINSGRKVLFKIKD